MAPTIEQLKALRGICDAVVSTVKESGPMGAPAGILYAALMAHGCSLSQFQSLMAGLVRAGKVTQHGDVYRAA